MTPTAAARPVSRSAGAVLAAACAVLLVGCGDRQPPAPDGRLGPPTSTAASNTSPVTAPPTAAAGGSAASFEPLDPGTPLNVTDVVFLQQMLAHELGAARLAELAAARGSTDRVRRIGEEMQRESAVESRRLGLWLTSIGIDPGSVSPFGHDHGRSIDQDLADLADRGGADFDRDVLGLLVQHSIGATQICKAQLNGGGQQQLREFAAVVAKRESDRVLALAEE